MHVLLIEKTEGKKLPGIPRRRWKDNIIIETVCQNVELDSSG